MNGKLLENSVYLLECALPVRFEPIDEENRLALDTVK
jgi:hypothetical protein